MNDKIKVISPHKICPKMYYTFTISPSLTGLIDQADQCEGFLHALCKYAYFDMRGELSDVSRRLHYHGTIRFKDHASITMAYNIISDYKKDLSIEIDYQTDWYWYVYCRKSRHITKRYLKDYKINYHLIAGS
jgi:hypothetical protein